MGMKKNSKIAKEIFKALKNPGALPDLIKKYGVEVIKQAIKQAVKQAIRTILIWLGPWLAPIIGVFTLIFLSIAGLSGAKITSASEEQRGINVPDKAHEKYLTIEDQSYTQKTDDNHCHKDEYEYRLPWAVLEEIDSSFFDGKEKIILVDENGEEKEVRKDEFMKEAKNALWPQYIDHEYDYDVYTTHTYHVHTYTTTDPETGEETTHTREYWTTKTEKKKRHLIRHAVTWEGTFKREYEPVTYAEEKPDNPSDGDTYTENKIWEFKTTGYTYDYNKFDTFVKSKSPKSWSSEIDLMKKCIYLMLNEEPSLFIGGLTGNNTDTHVSDEKINEIKQQLPEDIDQVRRDIVNKAYELRGKVEYFWGGKYYGKGWNDDWGKLKKVTAPGSRSTGQWEPYGLDCSGYVSWVFNNVIPDGYSAIGDGSTNQLRNSVQIPKEQLLPGDLVFIRSKTNPNTTTHVGIVAGRDENNNIYIIHENASANNVSVSGIGIFDIYARPKVLQ